MAAMKMLTIALLGNNVAGKSLEGVESEFGECRGLVRLVSPCGLPLEYKETKAHINFKAATAVLEGCGCFRLFERKNSKGRSLFINMIGEHSVPLKRVRSIAKVSCPQESDKTDGLLEGSVIIMDLDYKKT